MQMHCMQESECKKTQLLSEIPKILFQVSENLHNGAEWPLDNGSVLRMQYMHDGMLTKSNYSWYFDAGIMLRALVM